MVAQQLQSHLQGHAFEARVYAESPAKGFMPSPGKIASWRVPTGSVAFSHKGDVRVDSGVQQGDQVLPCSALILRQIMTDPAHASCPRQHHSTLGCQGKLRA